MLGCPSASLRARSPALHSNLGEAVKQTKHAGLQAMLYGVCESSFDSLKVRNE